MSTAISAPPSGRHRAEDAEPEEETATEAEPERGRTTLEPRVVERIAAHAVTEVAGVGGSARRVLGVAVGSEEADRAARVRAEVTAESATLDVRLSVAYPDSVAATTERARAHLIERTGELTGLAVRRVDIVVTALHSEETGQRRVS
ncbi:Asp23/Gls24 family envelope stress response protein [Amycolatopsis nigrescens]|uniref:Asp23/Gls24 family envelope stress response protein n=1 Tax=Amycolatopsis nigrescens TaxID=381445 RepID=UPI0003723A91|nr:Asp23/Gls24 family envelope stress response protein [Amycolatopsis nigrescens]